MVDVTQLPKNGFGYVPTPALVAPIEFTMRQDDYAVLGGHVDSITQLDDIQHDGLRQETWPSVAPWPYESSRNGGQIA